MKKENNFTRVESQIVIYQIEDNQAQIDVKLENDSVLLTQEQIAELFQKYRPVITRYINKVFQEGELVEKSNMQKMYFPFSDKLRINKKSGSIQAYILEYDEVKDIIQRTDCIFIQRNKKKM